MSATFTHGNCLARIPSEIGMAEILGPGWVSSRHAICVIVATDGIGVGDKPGERTGDRGLLTLLVGYSVSWTSRPRTISSLGPRIMPRMPWLMPSSR